MWELEYAILRSDELHQLLENGWEPFSAYSEEFRPFPDSLPETICWVLLRKKKQAD